MVANCLVKALLWIQYIFDMMAKKFTYDDDKTDLVVNLSFLLYTWQSKFLAHMNSLFFAEIL